MDWTVRGWNPGGGEISGFRREAAENRAFLGYYAVGSGNYQYFHE
jgi:hypothetical protein